MEPPRRLKILAGSDLHNDVEGFDWFCGLAAEHSPDLVVFLGDFVTGGPVSFVRETANTIRGLAPHSLVIPGNHDPRECLVELDIAGFDGLKHLHKQGAYIRGYRFAGLGGSIHTPKHAGELEFPDEGYSAPLEQYLPADVWLLHNPLKGILDEMPSGASLGSQSLLDTWTAQAEPPVLVFSGHVHAQAGTTARGPTTFVNPGSLMEGSAAVVVLEGFDLTVEMATR